MTEDDSHIDRRAVLGSLATATTALAGCSRLKSVVGSGDRNGSTPAGTDSPSPTQTGTATDSTPANGQQDAPGTYKPMRKPAATFEDLSFWTAHAGVKLSADSKTAYSGSQSARIEGRSGTIQRKFPVPVNLQNKDISLVLKVGGPLPTNVRIWLYDTGGNVTRLLQGYHTKLPGGWVRINPSINSAKADMSSVQRLLITIDGPAKGKRYWVDSLRFHEKTTKKAQVLFTFDYATRSIYEIAYPMMKKRDIVGSVAVPADHVGNAGRLTWDELKELKRNGWEIASMTNDWEPLYGQREAIQRRRMERAKRLISDQGLGDAPTLMYPKGFCDNTSLKLADELHDLAFLRFSDSERGLSQSAIMGPTFVNRSRPNTPHAFKNQIQPAVNYRGIYTVVHSKLGSGAQNTRGEFRRMLDHVVKKRRQGKVEIATPSKIALGK